MGLYPHDLSYLIGVSAVRARRGEAHCVRFMYGEKLVVGDVNYF